MRIADELIVLRDQHRLLVDEVYYRRDLDDDAQRDAIVGNAEDRVLAYETAKDRRRSERLLAETEEAIRRLERRRQQLLDKLL